MVPGTDGSDRSLVLPLMDRLLADSGAALRATSADLLGLIDPLRLEAFLDKALGDKPSRFETFQIAMEGMTGGSETKHPFDVLPSARTMGMVLGHLSHEIKRAKYRTKREAILRHLKRFALSRPAVALSDRERMVLRGTAAMVADGGLSLTDWHAFYTLLVWAGGQGQLDSPEGQKKPNHLADAQAILLDIAKATLPSHPQHLAAAVSRLAAYQARSTLMARLIADCLVQGARWLEAHDVAGSRIFRFDAGPRALHIGYLDGETRPLTFSGNESLITIGPPGSGKTQGQVIPNLRTYPGSVFVLDIKGELYDATAETRRSAFGPVYRFAPTDEAGRTQHYNPFDLISDQPVRAAAQCQQLANELIPENPAARDPYWENKARELVWAFALTVALDAPPDKRNLGEVSQMLSLPTHFEDQGGKYLRSPTKIMVEKLKALANIAGVAGLAMTAQTIENGVTSTRLESIFDSARAKIDPITRTPSAMAAIAKSDWTPHLLRTQPGSTVYLCLKPGELRAFAPLVRLMFVQHVAALTQEFTFRPGDLPVTVFLDEMPQLGAMPSLTDIIDIGRGAGLRLWMFAQYLGQIRDIYGVKADGLINACAVRAFLQPDLDAARFLAPQLGTTRHLFTGEQRALAEPHDLVGRAFADRVLVLGRGEHPANLRLRMAWVAEATSLDPLTGPIPAQR